MRAAVGVVGVGSLGLDDGLRRGCADVLGFLLPVTRAASVSV